MDLYLNNKVSLVCAASEGLGKASALELAKEGSKVAICSRSKEKLLYAKEQISKETGADIGLGGHFHSYKTSQRGAQRAHGKGEPNQGAGFCRVTA